MQEIINAYSVELATLLAILGSVVALSMIVENEKVKGH